MIEAIIFDKDGVLFDTERLSSQTWEDFNADSDFKVEDDFCDAIRGCNLDGIRTIFYEMYGPLKDFDYVWRRHKELMVAAIEKNGVPLKPNVVNVISALSKKFPLAVASSANGEFGSRNLKSAGLYDFFSVHIFGTDVEKSKPFPDIFLMAAEKLGKKPENCLVCEDSINGIVAAFRAGCIPVMIPDLMEPTEEIKPKLAGILENLDAIEGFITKYNLGLCNGNG